jgi:signal transduction histidine kinase
MRTEKTGSPLSSAAVLRLRAEERMGSNTAESRLPQSQEAVEQMVHEYEVHQIELVMQNEELRQARYETESALQKYTDLYESAPGGDFTLDRNGFITAANLAAADLLRIERSLIIGRSFELFIREEFRPRFTAFLEAVFAGASSESCAVVILNNINQPLTVQIEAAACTSGEECRLSLVDITGLKQNGPKQKKEQTTADLTRVKPDMMELELGVCTLRQAVDASLEMLREKIRNGAIDLTMDLAPEIDERIVADEGMLEQIMFSLLSNAVRFTPAGGSINVSAARDAAFITITVADTGAGICEEDIPKLFDVFTPLDSVYSKKLEGTGLELSLIRRLVELHGGTIRVESQRGTGSRFSFTIPLRNCVGIT